MPDDARHAYGRDRMQLYLNDWVRFKPTERGLAIWRDRHRETERVAGHPIPLRLDEDGYATGALWMVIQVYGPHIGLGLEGPIEVIEPIRGDDKARPWPERECPDCGGTGTTEGPATRHHPPIVSPCRGCGGRGTVDVVLGG